MGIIPYHSRETVGNCGRAGMASPAVRLAGGSKAVMGTPFTWASVGPTKEHVTRFWSRRLKRRVKEESRNDFPPDKSRIFSLSLCCGHCYVRIRCLVPLWRSRPGNKRAAHPQPPPNWASESLLKLLLPHRWRIEPVLCKTLFTRNLILVRPTIFTEKANVDVRKFYNMPKIARLTIWRV